MLWRLEIAAPFAGLVTGLYFVFGPIIRSGFTSIFDGLGDVRLVNYSLEHSYLWLAGNPLHADLWSPPLFYPQQNVAAYTDLVVGFAAPYWGFRASGLAPETAYLAWMLVVWTLNFAVVYLLLRKGFSIGALGSSLGAFLFTFASPRSANIVHQQLVPWFFLVLGVAALMVVFGDGEQSPRSRHRWITLFFAALVLQAYTAIYPLYFFTLGAGVVLLASLIVEDWRRSLLAVLRRDGLIIGVAGVVAVIALAPLASHYLQAAEEVGVRDYPRGLVPRLASWVLMGQTHPWYGWLQQRGGPFFQTRASFHSNGVGPITTLVAVIGLYGGRGRKGVRLLVIMAAGLMLMSTVFPGGFTFWRHVYDYVPGANALRAVGRIGLVLLLPLGLGVALFFDRLYAQARYLPLVLLAALMIAEQNHDIRYRLRAPLERYIGELSEKLDPGCEAFFLASTGRQRYPHAHDDAAWVSLRTGIPTVNGRYGNVPPEYLLQDAHLRSNADRPGLRRAFDYWLDVNDLPARRICWIETPGF